MSVRITTDSWLVPERDRYGSVQEGLDVYVHVFTTITHNCVGVQLERTEQGGTLLQDHFEFVLSNADAQRLVATLTRAIENNNERNA